MKVGIIGLGLMGGSFALALKKLYKKKNEELEIVGYDLNDQHSIEALELSIVDKIADSIDELLNLDLIVLAIPVNGIIKIMQELKGVSKNTTIVDFGSTKEKIIKAIPKEIRANFVAAHPMTGTEKSGPKAAIDNLYHGKVLVLCNSEENSKEHLQKAKNIFKDLGMKIFYMDGTSHDKHAAYISHMPHAVSYALANAVMSQENPKDIIAMAGGGFKSMSRIAKSLPPMWVDIFKQNKNHLIDAVDSFCNELNNFNELVKNEQWDEVENWIKSANRLHEIL